MRLRWAGRESVRCTTQGLDVVGAAGLRAAESLATEFVDFNELLSLGYMEGDRISVRCHSFILLQGSDRFVSEALTCALHSTTMMERTP